ncbi:MAG: hypothetical protein ACYDDI_13685 [Candidatus Acidiferrales bacterium]
MKVEKGKFDSLLGTLVNAKPKPRKKITTKGMRGSKQPIFASAGLATVDTAGLGLTSWTANGDARLAFSRVKKATAGTPQIPVIAEAWKGIIEKQLNAGVAVRPEEFVRLTTSIF